MPDLILPSLEIQNFRAFEHLRIERLGRVNLITGKNNVGKTSLLEALYLYANGGAFRLFKELLSIRDELYSSTSNGNGSRSNNQGIDADVIRHLFYNRPSVRDIANAALIGPVEDTTQSLKISLDWFNSIEQVDEENEVTHKLVRVSRNQLAGNPEAQPYITVKAGSKTPIRRSLERMFSGVSLSPHKDINEYIRAHGLSSIRAAMLWDNVTLTSLEDDVVNALRIVVNDVDRVSIISEREDVHGPIPIASVKGQNERFALRSLGEGINRLFGLALALVNVQNGILLVDEIETGLHYSVMPDVWRLIFQVAKRLNVQVFATTHSWDCIEAFERAAREDEDADGELIHLINKNGKILAVLYDEQELQIVTRELIEVR